MGEVPLYILWSTEHTRAGLSAIMMAVIAERYNQDRSLSDAPHRKFTHSRPSHHFSAARRRYRGTSLIRKRPPPSDRRRALGTGYGRVLGGCVFLSERYPCMMAVTAELYIQDRSL